MINFLIILIFVNFIRKSINTKEVLLNWNSILDKLRYIAPAVYVGSFMVDKKFDPTINFLWFVLLLILIYILWLLKDNRIAKVILLALLPYFIINSSKDFVEVLTPVFYTKNDDYFDLAWIGGFLWMLAFGIGASNQSKELAKEAQKNKIILTQKEQLEVLVADRTKEILEQKQELEKTLIELKATQNQLIQSEKLASLGELTAGIAHEIQNPLNFVNNFSELSVALAKELNEEIEKSSLTSDGGIIITKTEKEYLTEILTDLSTNQEKINLHGKRASSIVKGMLEHSRTSTGIKELTDINKLADEYLRLSYHGLRAKDKDFNSDFELVIDKNLPKINIIPQDIGRVLLNIINNAFYAVQKVSNPLVVVSSKTIDNQIVIKIQDNGTGISEATKAKIFQPFFTTKPTGQGTGLGLSLAYDIITKGHGGSLEVESLEGEGSTFIVKLPNSH